MTSKQPVLIGKNIKKSFDSESDKGKLKILTDVNITVQEAEIAAIVGSSGSGKSTLLHILGGLDRPDTGEVRWNNTPINYNKPDQLADFRNKNIGFVFQFHHLLPEFTAIENVMMPALIRNENYQKAEKRATSLLARFGLKERLQHRPSQLSGGEQQRVSMARALMNNPPIILADEPTGNLDESNTGSILSLLFELRETDDVSILLITHEQVIAKQCDTVYNLENGLLIKEE